MVKEAKDPTIVVVLEVGMHCKSCASKIAGYARGFKGVENVNVDIDSNKLTVEGRLEPSKIKNDLQRETKKQVRIVSAQPKNGDTTTTHNKDDKKSNKLTVEGRLEPSKIRNDLPRKTKKQVRFVSAQPKNGDTTPTHNKDDKKSDDQKVDPVSPRQPSKKDEEKSYEKKPDIDNESKEVLVTTAVVLKLRHYCQGCCLKIHKIVWETNGVQEMAMDEEKEMITVKGTMNTKVLVENLKKRLNSRVEIWSCQEEKCNSGSEKDTENGSDDGNKKQISTGKEMEENGRDHSEVEGSIMELKPAKTQATIATFRVPLHCNGCIRKIRKIIKRIKGVQEVTINKEEETVTVKATIDVKTLTETMKKRLKKLVEEKKIEIQKEAEVIKATSQNSFQKPYSKQETSLQEQQQEILRIISFHQYLNKGGIQNQSLVSSGDAHTRVGSEIGESSTPPISEQQPKIFHIISIHQDLNEGGSQNQSLVSSGDAHTKLGSEIGESSPTSEQTEWAFLMMNLLLEGVSAVLDQLDYLLLSMVLAFVALLLSTFELVEMARREKLISLKRSQSTCFYCHWTDNSPPSELFMVVQCFGLTSAIWQCLYSTVQYIFAQQKLDNPIKMTLLPFIFLLCVLISKVIRKMEEINCQDLNGSNAKNEPQSNLSQYGNVSSSSMEPESRDHVSELTRKMEHNDQTSKRMEPIIDVPTVTNEVPCMEFGSGDFGCLHYRRRCKIRAPCCNEIFDCLQCHNEAKETGPRERHHIPSHEIIKVICSLCVTEQDVQQNCINCGVCMGKYFCAKCKLFDDDVSKKQYHCDECGICRNGGRENFFHCERCGFCCPKLTEDAHCCAKKAVQ